MAAPLAQELRRHLAGQAQHRLVAAEGSEQRGAGIEHAGTGHHAEHAGPSAGAGIAERHVAAGLLVPRTDDFQLRLMEGVEQAVDLRAGQTEHGIDAVRHKAVDDGFSTGSYAHCTYPICQGVSSTTPLRKMPTPSASTSMTSPGFR